MTVELNVAYRTLEFFVWKFRKEDVNEEALFDYLKKYPGIIKRCTNFKGEIEIRYRDDLLTRDLIAGFVRSQGFDEEAFVMPTARQCQQTIKKHKAYCRKKRIELFIDDCFRTVIISSLLTCGVSTVSAVFCIGAHQVSFGRMQFDEDVLVSDQPVRWQARRNIATGIAICSGAVFGGAVLGLGVKTLCEESKL